MGDIKKVLSRANLSSKPFFEKSIRIESAEAIHLHWRDLRVLLSPKQFDGFLIGCKNAEKSWDGFLSTSDITLSDTYIPDRILFENDAKIELLRDGNIHIHWRDLRLEVSVEDFKTITDLFKTALDSYDNEK